MKEIRTNKAPEPVGPYSQAVQANNFVFISGQLAINPKTNQLVQGDIQEQTSQVFNNIKAILEEANLTLKNIVKVEIYLKDINDFKEVNKFYTKIFSKVYPARQVVEVSNLPLNAKIEIACIACKD